MKLASGMQNVLAWGAFRGFLQVFNNTCAAHLASSHRHEAFLDMISSFGLYGLWATSGGAPKHFSHAAEYILHNPAVLTERNEQGLTLLMEASAGKGCEDTFHAILGVLVVE